MGRQPEHDLLGCVGARDLASHASFAHDDDAMGERKKLGQIAGGDKAAGPSRSLAADDLVNFELGSDVDPLGRFVQEKDLRGSAQPFGDDDLLLVTSAEAVWARIDVARLDAPGRQNALRRPPLAP